MRNLSMEELLETGERISQARAKKDLLGAELAPSAAHLAQALTSELLSLGLDLEDVSLPLGEGETSSYRVYSIRLARWRVGLKKMSAPVLCRDFSQGYQEGFASRLELLWDPRDPSRSWGEQSTLPSMGLKERYLLSGTCVPCLASVGTLASFSQDAAELLSRVCESELASAAHLQQGLSCADALLTGPSSPPALSSS